MAEFSLIPPSAEDYLRLRARVAMGRRSPEGAKIALENDLFAQWVYDRDRLVGMGRVQGDGGCFAFITDMAVDPGFQGRGIGGEILDRLLQWADANLPSGCLTSLIANPSAVEFYKCAGFFSCQGMGRYVP
ncbi:GNAT family N-acetyltransferase [Qingshengfaniella alkalisoli]|uniref:GNAT family N-acetyltransferase n=1 Tax=Qingshengfaniella alkalisoli TaxID=2599296 RepID=A0A5B8IUM7_9RHOB|nr:GNAT family N-acetyltransferase [Qingshengfaniella alkalisoli]QDY69133.1 GNAT family N-acetyltransferase [Qingshengfaniella alkalisoli]